MVTLAEAIAEAQRNARVCPQPQQWNRLYQMLPNRRRRGLGWEPALPLILAAWWDTPAVFKILRLREHLEWADEHECLQAVYDFMRNLPEVEWYHMGD